MRPPHRLALAALVGLLGTGCTADNPDFCDPARDNCQPLPPGPLDMSLPQEGDLDGPQDLAQGQDGAPPPPDLTPACIGDDGCKSRVCLPDGRCADEGEVVYVNSAAPSGAPCTGEHRGTLADPVCSARDGVALARKTSRRYVSIAGSRYAYDGVQIEGQQVELRGPGLSASPLATIRGGTGQALRVSGSAQVVAVGLDLAESTQSVVSCRGGAATPSLRIASSLIRQGGQAGVAVNRCALSMTLVQIYLNNEGGVSIGDGGDVQIDNTYVVYNRGPAIAALDGKVRARFSTLAYNGLPGARGGLECAALGGSKAVETSIIFGNSRPPGGSQISAACKITYSAIDEASVPGEGNRLSARPEFVSNMDLHLRRTASSSACCIDQLPDGPLTRDITWDIDGQGRPQGPRWDIGADEVK